MRKTTGISLMLLIFLSLCLITFSLLSLSSATADEKLSRKAADRTTEYYQADAKAQEILKQTDLCLATFLSEALQTEDPESTWLKKCESVSHTVPDVIWSDGILSFTVSVNDSQILLAQLEPSWPLSDTDTLYRIITWKIVNTGDWNPDTRQNVYQPET